MILRYMNFQNFYLLFDYSLKVSFKHVKCYPRNLCFQSLSTLQHEILAVETETDVGATEFLSHQKGFSGILRHRYSDFKVNEISSDKEIVRLSNLGFCEKTINRFFNVTRTLHKNQTNLLMGVFEGKIVNETEVNVSALENKEIDDLCQILKKVIYKLKVYRKKTDFGEVIVLNPSAKGGMVYTNFVLYKENQASMDSVQIIARLLGKKMADLGIAGMKDKRAVTCQRATIREVNAKNLLELNDRLIGIRVGGVYYDSKHLRLGDLYGNHFTIVLRNIDAEDSVVNTAMESFAEKGFINYYGLQRFGRTSLPILAIGQKLFSRDWKTAVEMIIKPSNAKMKEDLLKCRQVWWETRDSKKALSHLHYKYNRVGLLLKGMVNHNDNYELALEWLPTNILQLYLHSYCSYVWNQLVSRRIREFGTSPVLGDLVAPNDVLRLRNDQFEQIRVVDEEMLQKDDLSMYSVVLPLPGDNIRLPENTVRNWYTEILEKDGLNLSSFRSENKRYCVDAKYRHVLRKPENVIWSFVNYNDPDEILILSDYEKLQKLDQVHDETVGTRRALKMEFTLLSSSYATSALREITHSGVNKFMFDL